MESKLLAGGKNIIDRTDEQQKALERQRQEMIEQKVQIQYVKSIVDIRSMYRLVPRPSCSN